jgi:hypothetical protein
MRPCDVAYARVHSGENRGGREQQAAVEPLPPRAPSVLTVLVATLTRIAIFVRSGDVRFRD